MHARLHKGALLAIVCISMQLRMVFAGAGLSNLLAVQTHSAYHTYLVLTAFVQVPAAEAADEAPYLDAAQHPTRLLCNAVHTLAQSRDRAALFVAAVEELLRRDRTKSLQQQLY